MVTRKLSEYHLKDPFQTVKIDFQIQQQEDF